MMSNRLTNKWTATAEEAFGETGARGKIGEEFVASVLKSWGWDVELFEDDYQMQVSGIDTVSYTHLTLPTKRIV